MVDVFENISLSWGGEQFEIYPNLEMIAKIENIITMPELVSCMHKGNPPFAKLAMAFGIILRTAGSRVSDNEIYQGMFSSEAGREAVGGAMSALISVMSPRIEEDEPPAKKPAPRKRATPKRPRKPTK